MVDIIIDTNIFVAFIDNSDKWNATANLIMNELEKFDTNLILLDTVFNEAINVIIKRLSEKKRFGEFNSIFKKLKNEFSIDEICWNSHLQKVFHNKIMNMIEQYNGSLNYNDSFITQYMIHNDIKYIISFDYDFDLIKEIFRISDHKSIQYIL
jgi:predicted nucleic acid-binding protein